ncbi:Maleylacetoacetate isomerase [Seminavis robusta]|uniref:Maleylacetoacetate isomerase n=1 Tax=Seminavis robusta TaxID=568900 RepID=A0A9N8DN15_9STRA|nr:Maleylacetoacetate isomerase [Seminavis robusta]|eukprot:Sro227_g092270.1 Maleylacetoacetate isomerase (287) ;mRNA; f:36392-37345
MTTTESTAKKCVFFDMKHSNSAARIRLWLALKGIGNDRVETKMISSSAQLSEPDFVKINPLKKVPAFVTDHGMPLFEASVIMGYLQDRFGSDFGEPPLLLDTPEDRALVELIVRCHDLYVASANCTQPNFSHTQGALYLDPTPTPFTPAHRTMNAHTRAAKLAELYKQLDWVERTCTVTTNDEDDSPPFLVGNRLTHADLTWYPTMVMIQFMLPRSIGWPDDFLEKRFPKLAKWFGHCRSHHHPIFDKVRNDILEENQKEYDQGWLQGVKEDVKANPEYKWNYILD